jgi:tetratricopeptide (TPR) repeat protein
MSRYYPIAFIVGLAFSLQAQNDSLLVAVEELEGEAKVKALNELFRSHIQTDPIKAIGFTREALNLATEIEDRKGMAASYNNLGVAYRNQGALEKALEYYITSMKIYEELKNNEGIATTKNNIANLYSVKRDYSQAMKYLEDSYNLFVQMNDQSRLVGSMNNLGNLYSDLQLYEKAMRYFSESYQLSEKLGQPYSDPLNNIGNIFFRQGNYQRAIENYQKALDHEKATNNRLDMLNTLANIGIAYTKANQPKPAQNYLGQAEALANELQAYSLLPAVLKHKSENYYKQGQLKEAYQTLLAYDSVREKIYGEESSINIAKMEMALNLQEKEKEFEILKREDEIKSLELRNSRLFIVLSILGVLLILASINFYFLGRRKRFLNT